MNFDGEVHGSLDIFLDLVFGIERSIGIDYLLYFLSLAVSKDFSKMVIDLAQMIGQLVTGDNNEHGV